MPSIRKSKKNLSKNKKTHKRNNKRSSRSRKLRSVVRKMSGGRVNRADGIYYIDESEITVPEYEDSKYSGPTISNNTDICNFINKSDTYNSYPSFFKNAYDKYMETKDEIYLDKIYQARLSKTDSTLRYPLVKQLKFPNGVFFRASLSLTVINNEGKGNISCKQPTQLKDGEQPNPYTYIPEFKLPSFTIKGDTIKDKVLYLYKYISALQLESILISGLHSKYGGIEGAERGESTVYNDLGKMFVGLHKEQALFYYDKVGILAVLLICKIPIEFSKDINLGSDFNQDGYMDTFFVGIIPSKFISVEIGKEIFELNDANLNTILTQTIENEKSLLYDFNKIQIESLSDRIIKCFTPKQITYFTPTQITYFTPKQIESFTPEQIESFTPEQRESFTPEQKKILKISNIEEGHY
jgi:hypothetical protein